MPTLLVVDDEPAILHAFRRVFREPEVTLLTSDSALGGIEVVQRQSPDVIILDVHLPDLSGLEALRRIRKLDSKVPVIVITGHGTTETAIEATKLGALDYLYKPLELAELRKLVNRAYFRLNLCDFRVLDFFADFPCKYVRMYYLIRALMET